MNNFLKISGIVIISIITIISCKKLISNSITETTVVSAGQDKAQSEIESVTEIIARKLPTKLTKIQLLRKSNT